VGPAELLALVHPDRVGHRVHSPADFAHWAAARSAAELAAPFTFVVDTATLLRLAPRQREHVVCAGGEPVLSAGEVAFGRTADGWWGVTGITNQSTGYCPDPGSWPAVATALIRAGLPHPPGFTAAFVFRRCPGCGELNIVREADFVCVFCDGALPRAEPRSRE
jgi:hypothetical protein